MNFPHTATIQRLEDNGLEQFLYADAETTPAFFQPLDIESSDMLNENFAKSSYVYLPLVADVKQNNRLVWNGTTYNVKGCKVYNFGNLNHKKALIEEL